MKTQKAADLRAHDELATREAAEWLYGTDGGPIDLGEAVGWLDAVGAPSWVFQAVSAAYREFRRTQASGRESGENLNRHGAASAQGFRSPPDFFGGRKP